MDEKKPNFLARAFSENGQPSSARMISGWLSVSSMALIWFIVRHVFYIDDPMKLQQWLTALPYIIASLAAFSVSPYGVAKFQQAVSSFSKHRHREPAE